MINIFLVSLTFLLYNSPKGSWSKSAKFEKLGKYWWHCTQKCAITNALFCTYTAFSLHIQFTEAVFQKCSVKKVFLKISQNSQENTCASVSFLIKLQALCESLFFDKYVWPGAKGLKKQICKTVNILFWKYAFKITLQIYWNRTSASVFPFRFTAYFNITF